jgi:hypothetical protein
MPALFSIGRAGIFKELGKKFDTSFADDDYTLPQKHGTLQRRDHEHPLQPCENPGSG